MNIKRQLNRKRSCVVVLLMLIVFSCFAFAGEKVEGNGFFKIFSKHNYTTFGNSIIETQDGYLVAGSIFDESGPHTRGWIAKANKKGEKIWEKELGKKGLDSAFYKAVITGDKIVTLVGSVNSRISATQEISSGWIVGQNLNGNIEWDKSLQLGDSTRIMDVKPTKKGSIVLVGRIREKNNDSAFIAEMDIKGNVLWTKKIEKGYWADTVFPLEEEGFVIGSSSLVARLDNRGNVLWEHYISKGKKND